MKASLLLLGILCLPGIAHASEKRRPETWRFSCEDLRAIVQQNGGMVFSTGKELYDRFVAHQGFCSREEAAIPAYVTALDHRECFLGFVCKDKESSSGAYYTAPPRASRSCREGEKRMETDLEGRPLYLLCSGGRWGKDPQR